MDLFKEYAFLFSLPPLSQKKGKWKESTLEKEEVNIRFSSYTENRTL